MGGAQGTHCFLPPFPALQALTLAVVQAPSSAILVASLLASARLPVLSWRHRFVGVKTPLTARGWSSAGHCRPYPLCRPVSYTLADGAARYGHWVCSKPAASLSQRHTSTAHVLRHLPSYKSCPLVSTSPPVILLQNPDTALSSTDLGSSCQAGPHPSWSPPLTSEDLRLPAGHSVCPRGHT